jgi:hypothetical protein
MRSELDTMMGMLAPHALSLHELLEQLVAASFRVHHGVLNFEKRF